MHQILHRGRGRLIRGTLRERAANQLPSFVFTIEKQVLLTWKVIKHGHFRNVGRFSDLGNSYVVEAPLNKQTSSHIRYGLPGCQFFAFPQTSFVGHLLKYIEIKVVLGTNII